MISLVMKYCRRFRVGFQFLVCSMREGSELIKRLPAITERYEIACKKSGTQPYAKMPVKLKVEEMPAASNSVN